MQRLGIVLPSSNTTAGAEFYDAFQGSGIRLHISKIPLKDSTLRRLGDMEKEIEIAAIMLKESGVDAAVFICTEYDAFITQKISKVIGCPIVFTSEAVVEALNEVRAHNIALATPYVEKVSKKEAELLEKSGFEVINQQSFNLRSDLEIGKLAANDAAVLARSANSTFADTLLISCNNLRTFDVLPTLEEELQKPVISSNSAIMWASLNALNSSFRPHLGRLFEVFRFHS